MEATSLTAPWPPRPRAASPFAPLLMSVVLAAILPLAAASALAPSSTPITHIDSTPTLFAQTLMSKRYGHTFALIVTLLGRSRRAGSPDAVASSAAPGQRGAGEATPAALFAGSTAVRVYTEAQNRILAQTLRGLAASLERIHRELDEPVPIARDALASPLTDAWSRRGEEWSHYLPNALLSTSAVVDCTHANILCCPLYWADEAAADPLVPARPVASDVANSYMFWNGTHATNGFFTNFSAAYLATQRCGTASEGTHVGVDLNGEWRIVHGRTDSVLREYDVTPHLRGDGALDETAWSAVPAEVLFRSSATRALPNASFGTSGLQLSAPSPTTSALVCAGLLAILLVTLVFTYVCSYGPRRKRLAAYRQQSRDAASTNSSATDTPSEGEEEDGYEEVLGRAGGHRERSFKSGPSGGVAGRGVVGGMAAHGHDEDSGSESMDSSNGSDSDGSVNSVRLV